MNKDDKNDSRMASEQREAAVLKRLLAMPPDHRRKGKPDASLKKRGRSPRAAEPSS
jgi:hypothetical protein